MRFYYSCLLLFKIHAILGRTRHQIIGNSNLQLLFFIVSVICIVSLLCPIGAGLRFASQGIKFLISLLRKRAVYFILKCCHFVEPLPSARRLDRAFCIGFTLAKKRLFFAFRPYGT